MRVNIGLVAALAGLLIPAVASAQLDGKIITMDAGDAPRVLAPVSVPYEGDAPDVTVYLEHGATAERVPVTIRDGELTFVPEGSLANKSHSYVVKSFSEKRPERVGLTKVEGKDAIDVTVDSVPFTTYYYSNDEKKPYLWPVLAEGGETLTRDWPMGEADESKDHPHHKSLWTAYGDVNGADCWAEGGNSGFQHSKNVTFGSGDAYGWIHAENVWQDSEHKAVVDETREYRFYAGPASTRLMDVTVTFTASYGEVKFGDTKEGGLVAIRMRDSLRERGGEGTVTTSAGIVGASKAWGKPAAWCDYSGPIEGHGVRGLAIFDHPNNLRYPTSWHIRDYGLNGANCFGYSYFTDGKENGDFILKDGESITFNYRVYVHSGDVEESDVAGRYADYATPPTAKWGK